MCSGLKLDMQQINGCCTEKMTTWQQKANAYNQFCSTGNWCIPQGLISLNRSFHQHLSLWKGCGSCFHFGVCGGGGALASCGWDALEYLALLNDELINLGHQVLMNL